MKDLLTTDITCRNSLANQKFVEKAIKVHKVKYDYSKVEYVNSKTKVCIICPEHGEFWQTPNNHLGGKGCPKCVGHTKTTEDWIKQAYIKHKDEYDYSKVNYVNAKTKVCIICKKHGEFWQLPNDHINGKGCPKCASEKVNESNSNDTDKFISKALEIHGNKYDYSMTNYHRSNEKVCIICPEHGKFYQLPNNHLSGQGCPKCGLKSRVIKKTFNNETFIKKAIDVNGEQYDYSQVDYHNINEPVRIICPKHGEFLQVPDYHLRGHGCPKCGMIMSKAEDDIINLLKPLECEPKKRILYSGKEIDVYIPSLKIGIEYNGLLWHSEDFGKDKNYHINKLNECNKQGIKLIQIFEDEWVNHREICESKLKQICGLNSNPKIYGRKCNIQLIEKKDVAYEFLDKNHIQGRTGFTIALGAFYEGNIVGVMCFKKEKDGYWDLNRFATDIHYQCVGIGGKLFKYFTTHYEFQEVKSFADRRWTVNPTDNLYTKLGFKLESFVKPTYTYYNSKEKYKRYHKFNFRKQVLNKKYGLPLTMTEDEMTKELGYTRIWDCGMIKYIFDKNDKLNLEKQIS